MEIKAIFKKYQTIILPTVSALIALVILALLIVPQALQIPKNNDEITSEKTRVDSLTKKAGVLDTIDTNKYQQDSNTSLIALPAVKDFPGSFGQALFFLQSVGLQLTNVSFSAIVAEGSSKNYSVRLQVSGNSQQITDFMEKLKSAPRIMKVADFTVSPASIQDPNSLIADVSLITYFKDLKVQAGAPETELIAQTPDEKKVLDDIKTRKDQNPVPSTDQDVPSGKDNPFVK
jgi:Tfp pilus assembly protein PilO